MAGTHRHLPVRLPRPMLLAFLHSPIPNIAHTHYPRRRPLPHRRRAAHPCPPPPRPRQRALESASEGARRKPRRLCFQYAGPEGARRRATRDQRHLRALPRIRLRAQALPHPEQHLRCGHPARRHANRQAPLVHLPGHPTTDRSDNYGIKTGYNKAFIIDDATKDALIAADPKSV